MWIEFVFVVVASWILKYYFAERNKLKEELTDGKEKSGGCVSVPLPEMGPLACLWQTILAFTVYWNKPTYELSQEVGKQMGPVVRIRTKSLIPWHYGDMINSIDLNFCKSVMSASSTFPDKAHPNHYIFKTSWGKPLGLLAGGGEYFKRSSRLTYKLLHQFEFFKPSKMEGYVLFEAEEVEAELELKIDEGGDSDGCLTFCPHTMFERNGLNVTWQVVASARFTRDDPVIGEMLKRMNKANREYRLPYTILELFPFLKHIPWLTWLGSSYDCCHYLYPILRKVVEEKRRDLQSFPREPRDLVDGFILEIDKTQGKDEYLNDDSLVVVMRDMLLAGTDTVNSALEHSILHLSLQPTIQERVQAEIDQIIGSSRVPSYQDKARMLYTQAVLLEVLRIGSPVPVTVRLAKDDTVFKGQQFEKHTWIVCNIYGIHRNEELWEDPEAFRPERFLDPSGTQIINTDKIIPFGGGRRTCPGESVALVTLFIFFVTIFRKFNFRISQSHPPPSFKNLHGVSRCPAPYYVTVRRRC